MKSRTILGYLRNPLYKNSIFLIANTVASAGLGFVFWMIVANFYTEKEVGWGSAVISAMVLLATLAVPGFGAAVIRFLPKAENPVRLINFFFTLSAIIATVMAAIFVAGLPLWSPAIGFVRSNTIFALAFVSFVVFLALSHLIDSVFIASRRADFVFYRLNIMQLFKLPLPVLLVLFFHTFGIAASWGIAAAAALIISLLIFLPKAQNLYKPTPRLKADMDSSMWRYCAGSYLTSVFHAAPGLVLPILVVNLLGPEQNAYFYIAWTIASLLWAIPAAVSRSLFAEGAHFEDELGANTYRSFRFTFLLLIPAIILLLLLGKWLLLLFGDSYSANGLLLLQILGLSSVLVGINMIYYAILRVLARIMELVIISGFITIGTLVGSYFILPATGITGISYAWLTAQGIISIYVVFILMKTHHSTTASKH